MVGMVGRGTDYSVPGRRIGPLVRECTSIMKADVTGLRFAATDLSIFSACRHATLRDRDVQLGRLAPPPYRDDPAIQLLRERGTEHEARYRELLEQKYGEEVFAVPCGPLETRAEWRNGTEQTLAAMKARHRVIFQAPLAHGNWQGRADFLERVDHECGAIASALGDYHYRAVDTKLAQEPRATAVLQLCVYSEIVALLQGKVPEHMVLVSPAGAPTPGGSGAPKPFELRTADFASYFRRIRRRMEAVVADIALDAVYPEVTVHCDVCSWWPSCNQRRRDDDHLSFVAGMSRRDQKLLEASPVNTLKRLGALQLPMADRPTKLREERLVKLQDQAYLQLELERKKPALRILTPIVEGKGLTRLPSPSSGDIFFDIESDRYAADGNFVYLFGWVELDESGKPRFEKLWARHRGEERLNFESFVDHVRRRREDHPDLHVYHFAPTERTVLSDLSGRYASREDEVDDFLRQDVLCDLLPIVKQGLRAGVEEYSLKQLEQFHRFVRETDPWEAARSRRIFERARGGSVTDDLPTVLATVENYNREDCESTLSLRNWLEGLRAELIAQGHTIARPIEQEKEPPKELSKWLRRVESLRGRLLEGVPNNPAERSEGQRARQLLADVLDWHRRKEKPVWREYFRIGRLTADECFEESGPIGNLGPERSVGAIDRSAGYEYPFPAQAFNLNVGDDVECPVTKQAVGEIVELRREPHAVVVKRTDTLARPPVALAEVPPNFNVATLQCALAEIADSLAATDFGLRPAKSSDEWGELEVSHPSARALLLREPPDLTGGVLLRLPGEVSSEAAVRLATHLHDTVLAVQGPPGAGKSYTGSRMILALLRQGKNVGVTATGHKVIGNLLRQVHDAANRAGVVVRSVQKVSTLAQGFTHDCNVVTTESKALDAELKAGPGKARQMGLLLAGTQYMWTSKSMRKSVDVLFVDEAGQFSLANALAVTVAANSLVLLGDPQQLAQPDQGTHPPGAGASALEHMLDGQDTIPADRGIFLDQTWRLPPAIASFTSAHFYSGRLKAHPDCAGQVLHPAPQMERFAGAGIFFERVEHEGNVSSSSEEAIHVVALIRGFLDAPTSWVDRDGKRHRLELKDILVVAPYNAQVGLIAEEMRRVGLSSERVGTVDKFQGQEAPVVMYSMTTSSPEDVPRDLAFLFDLNRLNVATSRAQAIVIVIASTRLLDAEARSPEQMRLINGLCGAVEMAEEQADRSRAAPNLHLPQP